MRDSAIQGEAAAALAVAEQDVAASSGRAARLQDELQQSVVKRCALRLQGSTCSWCWLRPLVLAFEHGKLQIVYAKH